VHALRSREPLREVALGIKWPNDIYLGRTAKLGKVWRLVNSTLLPLAFTFVVL
jgi:biotin-(acetyl-CoA carboxylase) ligase